MTNQANQPADKITLGTVQVAIWKNTNPNGYPYYSVSHENRYRDGNGDWQTSSSYSRDDSLILAEALRLAYHRMHELQKVDRNLTRAHELAEEHAQTQAA